MPSGGRLIFCTREGREGLEGGSAASQEKPPGMASRGREGFTHQCYTMAKATRREQIGWGLEAH